MTALAVLFSLAALAAVGFLAYRWRKSRDPVLRAIRDLRERRGGSTLTLEQEKAMFMSQTPLRGQELAAAIDSIAIWDPVDIYEESPKMVYVDDLPPGKEREEAEHRLEALRERREREVPSEARRTKAGRSEAEIRAAGDRIDLPFMAPTPLKPGEGIRYSDGSTLAENHRKMFPEFYADETDDQAKEGDDST